jgi:hypothetical protein
MGRREDSPPNHPSRLPAFLFKFIFFLPIFSALKALGQTSLTLHAGQSGLRA